MKHIFGIILLAIILESEAQNSLIGEWDCIIEISSGSAKSKLIIYSFGNTYENTGEIKYVNDNGLTLIHATSYEKGSLSIDKNTLTFHPLEADVNIITSADPDKDTQKSESLKELLKDETLDYEINENGYLIMSSKADENKINCKKQ